MRFGIVILPELRWGQAKGRWERAEEYGFDHAWTYDHLGWRDLVDGPWFDTVATLTAAALCTRRIRLGTHVASANFRHPAAFARAVTALDDMCAGRFVAGLGAGGLGFDSEVLGIELPGPRARIDRFTEFVRLLDLILRQDRTTWSGRYFSVVDARSTPGCIQRPRVPFVVAANAERSIELAAQIGDGWITTGKPANDADDWWRAVAQNVDVFRNELVSAGREWSEVDRYLSLDASPVFSLSSRDVFDECVERAANLGFTDVISHWPRPDGWYAGDERVLEEVATHYLDAATA